MMHWQKIISFCFLFFTPLCFCQKYTISGRITDAQTGEYIPGVNIRTGETNGTTSNNYGFYSLSINGPRIKINYSSIGYTKISKEVILYSDTSINIILQQETTELEEIIISADRNKIGVPEISTKHVSIHEIKRITGTAGEKDILRSLQYLPGVNTANEGVNSLSVRGGAPDQNLFLLDEAVIYNPNHALSLFSTFNPDAIRSVDFFKAAFPAKYGGRLSSVVDVRMREGNSKEYKVNGGIGLIASRISVEGPIKRDTSSFIISARYSYIGTTANIFASLDNALSNFGSDFKKGNKVDFYDINAKYNYRINNKNHVYISGYFGKDNFYFKNFNDNFDLKWGNISGTLRWNHIVNPQIFVNTSIIFSQYNYQYELVKDVRNFLWQADMKQFQIKSDVEHYFSNCIKLKYGIFGSFLNTLPGQVKPVNNYSQTITISMDRNGSLEYGAYVESDWKLTDFLILRSGIRFSIFDELGAKTLYQYHENTQVVNDSIMYSKGELISRFIQLEPRLTINIVLSPDLSIKASYNKAYQNLHLLSNSSVGMPTDIWVPSGKHIRPQSSNQLALALAYNFPESDWELLVEGYYKNIDNIIDFVDNSDLFLNDKIETQVLSGKAKAFGIEFFLNKEIGQFTGWISYTISKVTNKIECINDGESYPASYDKPHNFRFTGNYTINNRWALSMSFGLASGSNMTMQAGTYEQYGSTFFYYTKRNEYRVPAYHQLDLSAIFKPKQKRRWKGEWIFAINNIYNRKNVFSIYSKQDKHSLKQNYIYKMYLHGILPSVTYNFNF